MDKQREQFENWLKSRGMSAMKRDGIYVESMSRLWWECWQAAQSAQQQAGDPVNQQMLAALKEAAEFVKQDWYSVDAANAMIDHFDSVIAAAEESQAQQPADGVVRDAERYRWLRDDALEQGAGLSIATWCESDVSITGGEWVAISETNTSRIDAAIDAALAAHKAQEGK